MFKITILKLLTFIAVARIVKNYKNFKKSPNKNGDFLTANIFFDMMIREAGYSVSVTHTLGVGVTAGSTPATPTGKFWCWVGVGGFPPEADHAP